MNNVQLIGRLTHDPELKHGENASRTEFQMAINEVYYDDDGNKQEKANFPRVIAWRKTAENVCEYLGKGDRLAVTDGKIVTDSWEDDNGNQRSVTKVQANNIEFLGGGNGGGSSQSTPEPETEKPGTPNNDGNTQQEDDDDIPF